MTFIITLLQFSRTFTFQYGSNQMLRVNSGALALLAFTFQYGSNQIAISYKFLHPAEYLHFNMVLIKFSSCLSKFIFIIVFTFQYGSNQIKKQAADFLEVAKFTFQYGSNQIPLSSRRFHLLSNLHSNMVLIKFQSIFPNLVHL